MICSDGRPITLKREVSEFQPRFAATLGLRYQEIVTLKALANCSCATSRTPSEFASSIGLEPESQGCSNPGLELANAFSVVRRTLSFTQS